MPPVRQEPIPATITTPRQNRLNTILVVIIQSSFVLTAWNYCVAYSGIAMHLTLLRVNISKLMTGWNRISRYDTIRYDVIQHGIFTCVQKPTKSQLNLAHGNNNGEVRENWKQKTGSSEETVRVIVCEGSPSSRSEPTCRRGGFEKHVGFQHRRCLRDPAFSRFGTIPACDILTDGHSDSNMTTAYATLT